MSVSKEQRAIRYERLREAGFTSAEATKYKDRKKSVIEQLIKIRMKHKQKLEQLIQEIIRGR